MAGSKASRVDQMETLRRYSAAILLAIMIILNLIITPNFFSIGTLWNVITQSCTIILTGMGMTMVISTGGIDISVGAVMALSGMVSVKMLSYGVVPAIIAALLVCLVSGLIAGFMVGKLRVQSMVVTLALMIGVRGVAQILNDAKILYMDTSANADMYKMLGSYKIGGLFPIQLIPIVLSVVVVYFILEKTILGRPLACFFVSMGWKRSAGTRSLHPADAVWKGFGKFPTSIFARGREGTEQKSRLGTRSHCLLQLCWLQKTHSQ